MEIYATPLFRANLMLLCFISPVSSDIRSNFTDLLGLLAFKSNLIDPSGFLTGNWTADTSFCSWVGVSCTRRSPPRVAALKLYSFSLQGTLSPHISNLSFISILNLGNNSLHGSIPHTLTLLPRLSSLNLKQNKLSGPIPPSIFNITSLTRLDLSGNNLSGPLPPISNHSSHLLLRLQIISLSSNQLTGDIPSSFALFPALKVLSLSFNQFSGTMSSELPQSLSILYLGANDLTGPIPAALGNLSALTELGLGLNRFTGEIPAQLSSLQSLRMLQLNSNQLTGRIPTAFSNSSKLRILELSNNSLSGAVLPTIFTNMPNLTRLNLASNLLTGALDFITPLTNSRALENLILSGNKFKGIIPISVGNLSDQLLRFKMDSNQIEGSIPAGFGNLTSLLLLDLSKNQLHGQIPHEITKLQMLQQLFLLHNNIDGTIPHEISQMKSLGKLYLSLNNLTGSIPYSLGNLSALQQLGLAANQLTSTIPDSLWFLQGLIVLDLSENLLSGNVDHAGRLESVLNQLDLSSNQLTGSIPSTLGKNLIMLEYLDLSNNSLLGSIPDSISQLINIKVLNLSSNTLSGTIPSSLAHLRYLTAINLSFNRLEGEIPNGGVFLNLTLQSLVGNVALCGLSRLEFLPCSSTNTTNHNARARLLDLVLPVVASAVLVVLVIVVIFLILKRRKKDQPKAPIIDKQLANQRFISYQELVRATENFSETNLLGRGSVGSVFRGCLDDGLVVAVKVLSLETKGSSESFHAECRALCMVRHRNLVKIISTCSNLDFKALILQFMPNGSLESWLYSARNYCLTLAQRMSIMLHVALALEYIHEHQVVHCDLKPSNVLLDEDMTAHVGDFGIAKLLMIGDDQSKSSMVSASASGTIGYMSPEYGLAGRVSRKADVYSYGILLLEMFTRKKPTDAMFSGEWSLRQWVRKAYPNAILEIVDSELLVASGDGKVYSSADNELQCLRSFLELGLSCSEESPDERTTMTEVVTRLGKISTVV